MLPYLSIFGKRAQHGLNSNAKGDSANRLLKAESKL
jgi:hypothetical protein